ncbi:MAG: tetratricopeptide repeat protein, partial [Candidatus Dormibacteria bacterium]
FGDGALLWGDHRQAVDLLTEAIEVSRRLTDPYTVAVATGSLGEVAMHQGDYKTSRHLLDSALDGAGETGNGASVVTTLCSLGSLTLAEDDVGAARPFFARAVALAGDLDRPSSGGLRGLGEVATREGRWVEARGYLDGALAVASRAKSKRAMAPALLALGRLARAEGDCARALSLHIEALELHLGLGARAGMASDLEAVAGALADAGVFDTAARLFAAADGMRSTGGYVRAPAQRSGHDADVAGVREGLGAVAHGIAAAEGGAMSAAEAVACALETRGARVRARTGWSSLSRAELAVVEQVADGLTNVEIGRRLFLSPRTVETHLTHVFAKLGLVSRRQLARDGRRQ